MVDVIFYYTNAQKNVLNKSIGPALLTTTAELYDNTNIFNPELKLAWSSNYATHYNYFYIPQFERYYFLDDVVAEPGGAARVKGSVDVLYTYKGSLALDYVIVTRAYKSMGGDPTSYTNPFGALTGPTYIKDSKFPLRPERNLEVYEFSGSTVFNIGSATEYSNNFVLNLMGKTHEQSN